MNSTILIHREIDHELVGCIVPERDRWTPCTVFGTPLTNALTEQQAILFLQNRGLEALLDGWQVEIGSEWYNCQLAEVAAASVTVIVTDYGYTDPYTKLLLRSSIDTRLKRSKLR